MTQLLETLAFSTVSLLVCSVALAAPDAVTAPAADPTAPPAAASQAPAVQPPAPAAQQAPRPVPTLQHAPAATASMGDDFLIHASLTHPEMIRAAILEYRIDGQNHQAMFQRSSADDYVAVINAAELKGESFDYWITILYLDGLTIPVFASQDSPHRVQIVPTSTDLNEQALLSRVSGRRNVFSVMGEYVDFGHSDATNTTSSGNQTQTVRDWYYRVEASYTYRPLRLISEFSLRGGVVRGESPVPLNATDPAGNAQTSKRDVGLNYAAPTVRFRFADIVYGEGTLLTSVTEVGYSMGGGGALLLGDPYGTKLTLGFESIQVFGSRFFARTDIAVHPRLRLAPIIEVTNMPHADDYGVRLLGEVAVNVAAGVRIGLRGGYQARKFDSGSGSFGALFAYEL